MPSTGFDFRILISENQPLEKEQWNALARQCGNIWQSTFYDPAQLYFNNYPFYFQCFSGADLIAGVKIYFYKSKKLPGIIRSISSRATLGSEILFDETKDIDFNKMFYQLTEEIKRWLINKNTASFYTYSFFGAPEKLISLSKYKIVRDNSIGIARIDLTNNIETLWKEINPKHRSEIIKAEKNNIVIEFADDIEAFLLLMDETYKNQNATQPNKNFIRKEYEILKTNNSAQLVFAKHNENYLCGALLYNYGEVSLYNFGGTIKNSLGAGQFLHWEIMKHLKKNNFHFYYLGETSLQKSDSNIKFSEGITKFKLRFGAQQLTSYHKGYALKPFRLMMWNLLQKLFIKS